MIDFLVIYLPRLFDWVLKTSLMASILVGIILFVRFILRNKLTPKWHYLLWMILIVRLILPWSPESPYSIYSLFTYYGDNATGSFQNNSYYFLKNEGVQETTAIPSNRTIVDGKHKVANSPKITLKNTKMTANKGDMGYGKQRDNPFPLYAIAISVWLSGVLVFAFITLRSNHRLNKFVKKQSFITNKRIIDIYKECKKTMRIQRNIPLLWGEKISSPTILGFYRPKVLLPKMLINQLSEEQLRHIFYHELAHFKRRDIGINWLMYCLVILHWFNPILWLAYCSMRNDQELSCDAYALTFMAEGEKVPYGHTVISLLEYYSSFCQVPSIANISRNKRILKRRIILIKKFKKNSYRWSVLGIITLLAVAAISLLNSNSDATALKVEEQIVEKSPEIINKQDEMEPTLKSNNSIDDQVPLVYLYHTHNLESFLTELKTKDPALAYDEIKNISLVGDRLSESLKKEGIQSINDETDIMQILEGQGLPFTESYNVSRKPLEETIEKNKSIQMVFDIHRDTRERNVTTIKINDENYARIQFIVSGSSSKYGENKEFASLLHNKLEEGFPRLSRGVVVKNNPKYQNTYNQDVFGNSVLIEIGGVENTLQEEYRTADILAGIIKEILKEQ